MLHTQCPECQSAFRVNAKALTKARGRVKCGSCDRIFNALQHISVDGPAADTIPDPSSEKQPAADAALYSAIKEIALNTTVGFEERSKNLLKLLDDLAGNGDTASKDTGTEERASTPGGKSDRVDTVAEIPVAAAPRLVSQPQLPKRDAEELLDILDEALGQQSARSDGNDGAEDPADADADEDAHGDSGSSAALRKDAAENFAANAGSELELPAPQKTQALAAEIEAPDNVDEPEPLPDPYGSGIDSQGRKIFLPASGKGITAVVLLLILVLAGQYVHTSRQFLTTFALFNRSIGSVYRILGNPVTPAWNVLGWQFETTNGSIDDGESQLTISSRVSNRSARALPYPLVHVSLTDRWEEIIGSRVLEPNEYLADNPDPYKLVAAGDHFIAVIAISPPFEDVTGFKLNVCYRIGPGRLSCAIEDFR